MLKGGTLDEWNEKEHKAGQGKKALAPAVTEPDLGCPPAQPVALTASFNPVASDVWVGCNHAACVREYLCLRESHWGTTTRVQSESPRGGPDWTRRDEVRDEIPTGRDPAQLIVERKAYQRPARD